ncbi:MAG: hypothetical protein LBJ10_06850 [Clostridiales bacterium]|nr:hypothetical protein [Clostridiales bacterium]
MEGAVIRTINEVAHEVAYSKELLFNTSYPDEPGSMRVDVLSPQKSPILTVVVTAEEGVSVRNNIESIVKVLQHELFSRMSMDILADGGAALYFSVAGQQSEFPGCDIVSARFDGDGYKFEKAEAIVA